MTRLLTLSAVVALSGAAFAEPPAQPWPADVEKALTRAQDNRPQLERALKAVSGDRRVGMSFLVANMPDGDLTTLKADFLVTNVELAYRARGEVPWGKDVPDDVFLNDVLPYANVDEKRDAWRREFYDLCLPIAKRCKTPSEAAHKLNVEIFPMLKVGYSTQRRAPNQSPSESIEQGKASCTGLSIVLSDACRAVCVPARLVGTPLWANKRGNHTWVEIWDRDWRFTGACEPDKNGLDRGWFVGDAAQARKDSFEHAIYAASFRKTRIHFPLVWAMGNKTVPAENVTDRYAKPAPKGSTAKIFVRVVTEARSRVEVAVTVTAAGAVKPHAEGKSRGERADLNDLLTFELPPDREFVVKAEGTAKAVKTGPAGGQQTVEIVVKR
ncbi:MAG TPA: transglutaminase-like domain-containing protein [Gemmataceae bacterium]|nr:transglutaminase-like domain-containing protein [Gemmataceae bacterium]